LTGFDSSELAQLPMVGRLRNGRLLTQRRITLRESALRAAIGFQEVGTDRVLKLDNMKR
jgi:hypothetical protein